MSLLPFALSIILPFVGGSVAALWIFRKIVDARNLKKDEAIVGFIFSAVALIYAVVLAFVVFAVWDRYSITQAAVTNEAAGLVVAFRDTQTLPGEVRIKTQEAYRDYISEVINKEWKSHGTLTQHKTPDPLNKVWDELRSAKPQTPQEELALATAQSSLHSLENQRHLRHLAGEASLPQIFWPLLIGGGVLTMLSSFFFSMKDVRTQYIKTSFLATIISGVLFLIFSINYPYTGIVHVSSYPFLHALQQFNALNLK